MFSIGDHRDVSRIVTLPLREDIAAMIPGACILSNSYSNGQAVLADPSPGAAGLGSTPVVGHIN